MFSAQEGPKGSKMEFQKASKIKLFLESNKTTESCSRLHADLVFEVWRVPKSHFFWNPFRKPSSCCTGTLVFQIFDKNDAPESVQNRSKILPKMKQETKWKKHVKSGGGPPQIKVGGEGAAPCGREGKLHFAPVNDAPVWVLAHSALSDACNVCKKATDLSQLPFKMWL